MVEPIAARTECRDAACEEGVGGGSDPATAARRAWMAVFAKAPAARLRALAEAYLATLDPASEPRFRWLRAPETGLVMVRARMGGSGAPFNMGEMTATRCTVALEGATITGHATVAGRDGQHAALAAKLDALMQHAEHEAALRRAVVEPLQAEAETRRETRRRKVGATKVDFFTLVRGED